MAYILDVLNEEYDRPISKKDFCKVVIKTKKDCLFCDNQSLLAPDTPDANRPALTSQQ